MSGDFAALYSRMGRPSIAPERLLRAMLLQAFYSIRSERQLMERLEYDLLFRRSRPFDVLKACPRTGVAGPVGTATGWIAGRFLEAVLAQLLAEAPP